MRARQEPMAWGLVCRGPRSTSQEPQCQAPPWLHPPVVLQLKNSWAGARRLTVGAPRRAGMAVHLHVATANGEGSLADSTSNFLLNLKQLQLNGMGMRESGSDTK